MIIHNDVRLLSALAYLAGRQETEDRSITSMSRWLSGLANPILLLLPYWQKSRYTLKVKFSTG
ncbi:hypothetical protein J2X69_003249 [Algoriphagus sp. 4150]|nr:hypothetical protein [Algoriphagus sp. 4150]